MSSKKKKGQRADVSAFRAVIDRAALLQLAGSRCFERGESYFNSGLVDELAEKDDSIEAEVQGTYTYCVEIWLEKERLQYGCTCPLGEKGKFCKHLVATGLAWIEEYGAPRRKQATTQDDIRTYLSNQKKSALVDMIMTQFASDDRFNERLLMEVAGRRSGGIDIGAFCSTVDAAVSTGGFVEYREMWDYTRRVDQVVEAINDLLGKGHADDVIEITEYALAAVESAVGEVDDSSGGMGMILDELQRIHRKACVAARPDPEELARRLFAWEIRTEWDTFHDAAKTYSKVLGKKGLAEYRRLAEAEWETVPELKPSKDGSSGYDYGRYRITNIMRSLAGTRRDVEVLVAVESRDLSSSLKFLKVAEIYRKAGKPAMVVEWAEKGVTAFAENTDSHLREFLADEYHRLERHNDAMEQIWACFEQWPSLKWVTTLNAHAKKSGSWPKWRAKSLKWIRADVARKKKEAKKTAWGRWPRTDHSLLVEVFLWEKDEETAWREARDGGCSDVLWMKLAATREKKYPTDAVEIYKNRIEPIVAGKNKAAYAEATKLLTKIRRLMKKTGEHEAFADYLAHVRARHKPKRNFMKSLDRAKLK